MQGSRPEENKQRSLKRGTFLGTTKTNYQNILYLGTQVILFTQKRMQLTTSTTTPYQALYSSEQLCVHIMGLKIRSYCSFMSTGHIRSVINQPLHLDESIFSASCHFAEALRFHHTLDEDVKKTRATSTCQSRGMQRL